MFSYLRKLSLLILFVNVFSVEAQIVRMETVLGTIDIELRPDVAPNTVANFLNYVNRGDFNNSFIHRSINNFIVQGGDFKFVEGQGTQIIKDATVANEFSLSNVRGTIAMAKPANNPNGASSGWFFNVANNSSNLDNQNGGFTVFGTVIAGMDVVDAMNALPTNSSTVASSQPILINLDGQNFNFFDVPYLNSLPLLLEEEDAVMLQSVTELDPPLVLNSGLNGAWFNPETSGQGILIEYLPKSSAEEQDIAFMAWFTYDSEEPNENETTQVGAPGQRWLTGIGDANHELKSITFEITITSGGLFDNTQTVTHATGKGTMTITFEDCLNATATYTLTNSGFTGSFPLVRISPANVNLCNRLSAESNIAL